MSQGARPGRPAATRSRSSAVNEVHAASWPSCCGTRQARPGRWPRACSRPRSARAIQVRLRWPGRQAAVQDGQPGVRRAAAQRVGQGAPGQAAGLGPIGMGGGHAQAQLAPGREHAVPDVVEQQNAGGGRGHLGDLGLQFFGRQRVGDDPELAAGPAAQLGVRKHRPHGLQAVAGGADRRQFRILIGRHTDEDGRRARRDDSVSHPRPPPAGSSWAGPGHGCTRHRSPFPPDTARPGWGRMSGWASIS